MASTWGGTTIPAPTKYERNAAFVGSQYIVSDGSMVTDYVTSETVISLEWANITAVERATLEGKYNAFTNASLVIEDETSANVIPIAGSLRVSRLPGGTLAYTVSCEVRTTTVEPSVAPAGILIDFSTLIDGPIPYMTGPTFAVASGVATNTPTLGSELLTDPGLEATYTAGKCNTLTKNGSPTLEESADAHGGSKAQQFTAAAFNDSVNYPIVAGVAGTWYKFSVWAKRTVASSGLTRIGVYQAGAMPEETSLTLMQSETYKNEAVSYVATGTGNMFCYPIREGASSDFDTVIADDGSLKAITSADLWCMAEDAQRTDTVKAKPSPLVDGTVSGVVLWANSVTPDTYIMAWWSYRGLVIDRLNLGLIKCVGGTYTTLITATAAPAGVTDAWIEIRPVSDNSVALYYNNTQVGTTQSVADVPGRVAGFMVSGGNTLDAFYLGTPTAQAVLFAGSSFTASVISYSVHVTAHIKTEYPALLPTFANQAQDGAQTWFNLVRLGSYLNATNQIVILDTANDATAASTKDAASLEAFIRRLFAYNPGVQLIGISAPSWVGQDTSNNALAGAPTNLASITAAKAIFDHYGISYAAYLDEVVTLVNEGTYDLDELVDDTVHPTAAGYGVMAGLVEAFLPDGIAALPFPLPARLHAASADFEHTPSRILGTSYTSRTGTWADDGTSTSSSEADATITYSFTGRSYGYFRDDGTYPMVAVSIDGGAYSNMIVERNGHDIGTRAAHTVTIKVLTAAKIDEFWVI